MWMNNYYQSVQEQPQPQTEVKEEEQAEPAPTEGEVKEEEQAEETIKEEEQPIEEESIIEEVLSAEQIITTEAVNNENKKIAEIEFYLPAGAINENTTFEMNITSQLWTNKLQQEFLVEESSYKVIETIYNFNIEPNDFSLVFSESVRLKISYNQEFINADWEEHLVLGYFKDNLWTPLESILDTNKNTLSINFDILPSKIFAILVAKDKTTPKIEKFQIAPNIPLSIDSDNDGLTNIEENIFTTQINNPDTDGDGNPDGQEVLTLMHPLNSGEAQLASSGLINVYTNPTYSYSFFYPSSWLARALPETANQEVLVITNTGEFFSITVENNLEKLSPKEWYLRQSPDIAEELLFETIIDNQPAIWNPEKLTIYTAKEDRVYAISYNIGIEKKSNFKTCFEMLINSFQFIVQIQGRPNNTLIKYPDSPGVYLIENNKKRAFQSGEIFEMIGFKWEDVIEIPINEVYEDGDIISGRLNGTLIKYPNSSGIYFIEDNKKRAFQSGEIFEMLGFKWEDVIEILVGEIYEDGPIIGNTSSITPVIEEGNTTSTPGSE